jgi:hypothetical protein
VSPSSAALSFWALVLMVSFFFAVLLGAPFALVLSLLLRPVRPQWIHVLAFATGLAALTWGTIALLAPGTVAFPATFAAIAGTAAGLGRAAVIPDADIHDGANSRSTKVSEDPQQP